MVAILLSLFVLASATPPSELSLTSLLYQEKLVHYKDPNGTDLTGFLVKPRLADKKNKYPAVILFHAFTGRGDFDNEKAREIARMGYVAFAADTYGSSWTFTDLNSAFAMMGAMLQNRTTTLKGRIMAAWNYVNALDYVNKDKIGSIGFCYGGLCTLDLARFDVGARAVVAFHADLTNLPDNTNQTTRTAVQAHHGDADGFTTNAQAEAFLQELRDRKTDWMFSRYGGAEHAFTLPGVDAFNLTGAAYNPVATRRAWAGMEEFLYEKLKD